ncbi:MAG TPA: hypothetical protein VNI78_11920, partial [Vicinamibacterales bacterium]|nr:hypothetical protein [Vicinamibacterales bacterium]
AAVPADETASTGAGGLKEALLAEIRSGKAGFYNTVVAQAQRIEVTADRVTFAFSPNQKTLRELFEQSRPWLEAAAERVAGRRISVTSVQLPQPQDDAPADPRPAASGAPAAGTRDIKAEALASPGVQALLDVFPAEIRDVEELE